MLVLGPPAAGKRTLASILGRRANAVVLDEAAILSDAIDDGVDAARALQELRDAGKFVDPMLLVPLVLQVILLAVEPARQLRRPSLRETCARQGDT